MNRDTTAVEWIDAYLEWMVDDEKALAADAGGEMDFVAVSLDWMEEAATPERGLAEEAERTIAALSAISAEERDNQRETALLDALHMEAECMRVVAQILDRGGRSPEALAMALETLRFADRMLADEQRAWHALQAQRRWELALSPKKAWESQLDYRWDAALDHVAEDVHALTGRVLALQTFHA